MARYSALIGFEARMTSALSISHLRKVYRRGTVGVDDLSLEVAPGDFFGFLGPNGAGKSTTIHCVTGIANPSGGRIEVFGVDAVTHYRDARRLIGLSPQEFNVDTFANARQIVDWMGGYFGMGAKERRVRVDMLLQKFDLVQHAKKSFRELSGGLKRRVMLARAMINDPKLLILDEPTAGVDVELRRELWRYLQELNQDGKTIFLTSHYLEEVERLCRNIAIVSAGRIVRQGPKEDYVREEGGLEAAYLRATVTQPLPVSAGPA
ncbi:MAG TPA: ABC transporter ATP-binding protein [Rhizomicrobium sp.]|jgi:ABC-2 type transport system ATP-binding protein